MMRSFSCHRRPVHCTAAALCLFAGGAAPGGCEGSTVSIGEQDGSDGGGGATGSSGNASPQSHGASGSSAGASGAGSVSGSQSAATSGSASGSEAGDSSSSSGDSPDAESSSFVDASIPPDIPTAGTCSAIPVINGGELVTQLLAIANQSICTGANVVSAHSYDEEGGGHAKVNVCKLNGAVYYQSGMNIDCDGLADSCMPQHCPSDDPTNQAQTSFTNASGKFLSAGLVPYVVIPQDFRYPGIDQNSGGNVIAVIYNNQLEFAVWGDQGPSDIIGEASYSTANNLGIDPDPNTGGTEGPVTYIVFTGSGAVPDDLSNPQEAWELGMPLAQQLIMNNP